MNTPKPDDVEMPTVEYYDDRKEAKLSTLQLTALKDLRLVTIMEEAMKDNSSFRGATKTELDTITKYGVIIPTESDDKLWDSPRRDGGSE